MTTWLLFRWHSAGSTVGTDDKKSRWQPGSRDNFAVRETGEYRLSAGSRSNITPEPGNDMAGTLVSCIKKTLAHACQRLMTPLDLRLFDVILHCNNASAIDAAAGSNLMY